jgi:hypothetical protein
MCKEKVLGPTSASSLKRYTLVNNNNYSTLQPRSHKIPEMKQKEVETSLDRKDGKETTNISQCKV